MLERPVSAFTAVSHLIGKLLSQTIAVRTGINSIVNIIPYLSTRVTLRSNWNMFHCGMEVPMDRAVAIVELLSRHASGLPLMTIADDLAIPRSATHRLLGDLRDEGYVRQDYEGGAYRLTAKIVALGFTYLSAAGATSRVQPVLDRLAEETGELVTLAVIDAGRLIRLAKAQGARRGLLYNPDEGAEVYLAATSNGHAWLSCLDDEEVLQLVAKQGFKREGYGPNAPRSLKELLDFVERARAAGCAKIFETYEAGTAAVAVPIFRADGAVPIGTVSVAGPCIRMTESMMDRITPALVDAAREIGQKGAGLPIFDRAEH
ncbi:IclR family transcriptional regulator [Bosea vaviloviae]|nr:IclR family transcriptional regulator [Bosea vaviloviae]